jgi:hypothetical protein
MAQVSITLLTKAGLEFDVAAFGAATTNDFIIPGTNKSAFVAVNNNNGTGPVEVTIPAQVDSVDTEPGGVLDIPDIVQSIADGETYIFGPFPYGYVNDNGEIHIDYDDETGVRIAAFAVGAPGV